MSNSRASTAFRARRREDQPTGLPTGGREYNNPWWKKAACKGVNTELFYDDDGGNPPIALLKTCFDCPVMVTCRLAGYAESHGTWGLTYPYWRKEYRHRIFERLMGDHLGNVDDFASFRRELNALIEEGEDVVASMREYGFSEEEINLFLAPTPIERKAAGHLAKQETFSTSNQTYKKARDGVVFTHS